MKGLSKRVREGGCARGGQNGDLREQCDDEGGDGVCVCVCACVCQSRVRQGDVIGGGELQGVAEPLLGAVTALLRWHHHLLLSPLVFLTSEHAPWMSCGVSQLRSGHGSAPPRRSLTTHPRGAERLAERCSPPPPPSPRGRREGRGGLGKLQAKKKVLSSHGTLPPPPFARTPSLLSTR